MAEAKDPTAAPQVEHLSLPGGKKELCFVVRSLFSAEECAALIEKTEGIGYVPALINIGGGRQKFYPEARSNYRCIQDDEEMAGMLWDRIKEYIPTDMRGWPVVGLNERLRFLRYDPGQGFGAHYDGCYQRGSDMGDKAGEKSCLTFLLYLNDGYVGGRTRMLNPRNEAEFVDVPLETGTLLIQDHRVFHEGMPLLKGRKYALRTDVMFAPPPAELARLRERWACYPSGGVVAADPQYDSEVQQAEEWHRANAARMATAAAASAALEQEGQQSSSG